MSCKVCDTTDITEVCTDCYRNLCAKDTVACKICKKKFMPGMR